MMAFLSNRKKWWDEEKGIMYGTSHIAKYHRAIKRGAEYSGGDLLTAKYCDEMDVYLDSMKRQKTSAKQTNQIEEEDTNPIGLGLYQQISLWALEECGQVLSHNGVAWADQSTSTLLVCTTSKSPKVEGTVLFFPMTRIKRIKKETKCLPKMSTPIHSSWKFCSSLQWDVTSVSIRISMTGKATRYSLRQGWMDRHLVCTKGD